MVTYDRLINHSLLHWEPSITSHKNSRSLARRGDGYASFVRSLQRNRLPLRVKASLGGRHWSVVGSRSPKFCMTSPKERRPRKQTSASRRAGGRGWSAVRRGAVSRPFGPRFRSEISLSPGFVPHPAPRYRDNFPPRGEGSEPPRSDRYDGDPSNRLMWRMGHFPEALQGRDSVITRRRSFSPANHSRGGTRRSVATADNGVDLPNKRKIVQQLKGEICTDKTAPMLVSFNSAVERTIENSLVMLQDEVEK